MKTLEITYLEAELIIDSIIERRSKVRSIMGSLDPISDNVLYTSYYAECVSLANLQDKVTNHRDEIERNEVKLYEILLGE
jgi:hypothetical protein